jgi:Txe/YoeB family toxin of Txe-Axe toxin-antitoxin module
MKKATQLINIPKRTKFFNTTSPSNPNQKSLLKSTSNKDLDSKLENVYKIDIPEEMMILGNYQPSLNGQIGKIISKTNGEIELEIISKYEKLKVSLPEFFLTKI